MADFHLQIVTPDGLLYDGEAHELIVRTTEGDVGVMKGHTDYVAALDAGELRILTSDGKSRAAAVFGGFVSVTKEVTTVVAVTCEWADEIDTERAQRAKAAAEERIKSRKSDQDLELAEAKLKRALNRINVSSKL